MAFAARRRRKSKGLLDKLYLDFQKVVHTYDEEHETPPDQMTDGELAEIREQLQSLRRTSFDAVMSGDIEGNNAFVVFNDYLRWELQEIERIQRDRRAGPGATDAGTAEDKAAEAKDGPEDEDAADARG